jgi:hypothetical protein
LWPSATELSRSINVWPQCPHWRLRPSWVNGAFSHTACPGSVGRLTVFRYHPELVNLYGCTIGDNCKIAAFVEIQRR